MALTTDYTNDTDAGKTYRLLSMKSAVKIALGLLTIGLLASPAVRLTGLFEDHRKHRRGEDLPIEG